MPQKYFSDQQSQQNLLDDDFSPIQPPTLKIEALAQLQQFQPIKYFSVLRTIWGKPIVQQNLNQKIDQMNLRTARIKAHIKDMIVKQYNTESMQLKKFVVESKEFLQLKEKYDILYESTKSKQANLTLKINALEEEVRRLTKINNEIIGKLQAQECKLKNKQIQLLHIVEKCQSLELEMLRKQKQVRKIKKQLTTSVGNEVRRIRFRGRDFTVILEADYLQSSGNFNTTKTVNEIKSYLLNINSLEGLIEDKIPLNIPQLCALNHINQLETENILNKRKNIVTCISPCTSPSNRNQNILGSQQKKRRFERCRVMAQN